MKTENKENYKNKRIIHKSEYIKIQIKNKTFINKNNKQN